MIVKIGDRFYDSTEEPIMLILGEHEKEHLANLRDAKKYCSFPEGSNVENIQEWMKVSEEVLDKMKYENE